MQRAISSFPRAAPGVGLLLLRVSVAGNSILPGFPFILRGQFEIEVLVALVLSVSLVLGLLTSPAALTSSALLIHAAWIGHQPAYALIAVGSAALVLLGPGAYSFDGRLFGHRRVLLLSKGN